MEVMLLLRLSVILSKSLESSPISSFASVPTLNWRLPLAIISVPLRRSRNGATIVLITTTLVTIASNESKAALIKIERMPLVYASFTDSFTVVNSAMLVAFKAEAV